MTKSYTFPSIAPTYSALPEIAGGEATFATLRR
jgi:hypothetical protein